MQIEKNSDTREIPPMPGGGSWTFDEAQWAWISNDPVAAEAPDEAGPADAGNEQAGTSATDQE
ncbi:hypothetical protein [Massilia alkalitolerans]|uniref:hypothetical protein n=1 Tax=Massilia alkalitolerans TaxID=286638 RepID=UPI00041834CF|nr:hypothetical protein [Massilia alkalitolerans]